MPEFRTLDTGQVKLRAAVEGEGPLVVMVHGSPESWYSWRHQIGPVAEAGFQVAALDVRGYGGSDKPHPVEAYDMEALTGDVSGAIDGGGGKWYVLKQTGRRRAMTKSFEDAKPQIRNKLYRDKRIDGQNQFVADLRAKAKVQINEANLKKVRIESSTTTPDEGHGHMEPDSPVPGVPGVAPGPGSGAP